MRSFIRVLLLFCVLALPAFGASAPDFTLKKLGDGVYAGVSSDNSKAGSNAGFIIGSDGVLVVDSFEQPDSARQLLAEIRKLTNLPIRYLINTHYHIDHTGGDAVFAQAGAIIIAQRNLRGWLRTENAKFFGPHPKPEDRARLAALVLPNLVYSDAVDIYLGSRRIEVRYMLGHTGGDSVVAVPDANVVFAGDLVWQKHLPNLVDASTAPWIETLDKLLAAHPTAVFVSGHGDLASAADVRDFRGYLKTLRADVAQAQAAGLSGKELSDRVLSELKPEYGKWGFFDYFAQRNIQQTAEELTGRKRVPVPAPE